MCANGAVPFHEGLIKEVQDHGIYGNALMCAAVYGRDLMLVKLLDHMKPCINFRADVMFHLKRLDTEAYKPIDTKKIRKSGFGCFTPLMFAIYFGHFNCVKILIIHGADYRMRDRDHGDSILHIAAKNKRIEILEWLCKRFVDFDHFCTNDKGENAF